MRSYRLGPETPRLRLRAMEARDADAFFALNSHPDVMRYTGEPLLQSVAQARDAIERYPDFDHDRGGAGFGRWACVLKSTDTFIGFCGLKHLKELDMVDVGFRLLPRYWSQGLATEACKASLAFGFDVLALPRIVALVLTENAASIRVLEKCGMTQHGTIVYEGHTALLFESRRET